MTEEAHQRQIDRETTHRRYDFVRIWQKRYAHMKARHEGRSTNHSGSAGKGLMTQEEFFVWCMDLDNLSVFLGLYYDWVHASFSLWHSPSIDRIDSSGGYTADNIQWLGFAENCKKNNKDPITHQEMVA